MGKETNFDMGETMFRNEVKGARWRVLFWCIATLVVLVIAFAVLFAVYYTKYEDKKEEAENGNTSNKISQKVCRSTNCVAAAGYLLGKMDLTADPCEDFSKFVCGRIQRGRIQDDVQDQLRIDNAQWLFTLLDEDIQQEDLEYVKKMKTYYRSCMDTDRIEHLGLTPYKNSQERRNWPTLFEFWNETKFDLNTVIEEFHSTFIFALFKFSIQVDMMHPTRNILVLEEPYLCVEREKEDETWENCAQIYYDLVTKVFKADETKAKNDAIALVDFESALGKNAEPDDYRLNKTHIYNPTTFDQMSKDYPSIDWHRALQASFNQGGITIDPNMTVLVAYPKYFEGLERLLKTTPGRVIQNRFAYRRAQVLLDDLTEQIRGVFPSESEDATRCTNEVLDKFGSAMAKLFVNRTFSKDARNYVIDMFNVTRESFGERIKDITWMGEETKKAAMRKLEALRQRIAFPQKEFSQDYINRHYENMTITQAYFYDTRMRLRHQLITQEIQTLLEPVDPYNWQDEAYKVDASYDWTENMISIMTGMLQEGHFSLTFPSSINFGAIGLTIGHEITHGFDNQGSQFDENGQIRNWWRDDDYKNFRDKYQCFIDQYSKFKVRGVGPHVDGDLTLGENIADNGGIRVAYKAYKKFASTQPEELPLPGLGLTTDQQVFVGAAQLYCNKRSRAGLENQVEGDEHSPEIFRILGTMMNSEDFAKAFNCPVGSPMNPAKKCVVW